MKNFTHPYLEDSDSSPDDEKYAVYIYCAASGAVECPYAEQARVLLGKLKTFEISPLEFADACAQEVLYQEMVRHAAFKVDPQKCLAAE